MEPVSTAITRPGVRARHQARRQQAQRELLDSLEARLRGAPFASLSVEHITAGTSISRTNFYRYFPDTRSLLLRLFADVVDELTAAASPWLVGEAGLGGRSALEASLRAVCEVYRRHGPLFAAVSDAAVVDAEVGRQYRAAIDGFAAAVASRITQEQQAGRARAFEPIGVSSALLALNERHLSWSLSVADTGNDPSPEIVEIWMAVVYG